MTDDHTLLNLLELYKRTKAFQSGYFAEHKAEYEALSGEQHPKVLFITCSDSRILPSQITDSAPGEVFVLRNVANMVPIWQEAEKYLSVSAVIEFAVKILNVLNIIVCGHSNCGGCKLLQSGGDARIPLTSEWVKLSSDLGTLSQADVHARAFQQEGAAEVPAAAAVGMTSTEFEQNNALLQIQRLRFYPFIAERMEAGDLRLTAWHYDIATGTVCEYSAAENRFVEIGLPAKARKNAQE